MLRYVAGVQSSSVNVIVTGFWSDVIDLELYAKDLRLLFHFYSRTNYHRQQGAIKLHSEGYSRLKST